MRYTTIRRHQIPPETTRLEPRVYLGEKQVRQMMGNADARIVRLGDLLESIADGSRLPIGEAGIPMLRLGNVKACDLSFTPMAYVAPANAEKWTAIQPSDVILTQTAEPFRAAVLPESFAGDITISPELVALRPRPALLPEYLAAILSTRGISQILKDLAYRRSATALRRLRLSDIADIPIPLPGRSVQEAIRTSYRKAAVLGHQAETEMARIIAAVHAEIDRKIGDIAVGPHIRILKSDLKSRWDVSVAAHAALRRQLLKTGAVKPLLHVANVMPSTLKGLSEQNVVSAVRAEHLNTATLLVENFEQCALATLSPRMRQPLHPGDVLICTTGSGNQVAFLDSAIVPDNVLILGSATFTALHFTKTPRYCAVALTHPVVRRQLECLATGTTQRFVSKKELDALLMPMLSQVWREDFDSRVARAFERRCEALEARDETLRVAEAFFQKEFS